MDIPVSRLNNRMALQVPGELPLGLVFIVGRVENMGAPADNTVRFELVDAGYRLRCRLPAAVAEETLLKEKDRVRASGHLAFDSHSAQYQLLARDIEVLAARPPAEETTRPATAPVQQGAKGASLAPTELPPWVRKLAPPEVKEELELEEEGAESESPAETDGAGEVGDKAKELPPEMVAFLSNAIDSDEEIELTPEMIAEYLPKPEGRREEASKGAEAAVEEQDVPAPVAEDAADTAVGTLEREHEAPEEEGDVTQRAEEGGPSPPEQEAGLPEEEEVETRRPTVLPPPQGAPRRERQLESQTQSESEPRPLRYYLEYAVIAILAILVMAALILTILLLQT